MTIELHFLKNVEFGSLKGDKDVIFVSEELRLGPKLNDTPHEQFTEIKTIDNENKNKTFIF